MYMYRYVMSDEFYEVRSQTKILVFSFFIYKIEKSNAEVILAINNQCHYSFYYHELEVIVVNI